MQIDGEIVIKPEDNSAQGIALSAPLHHTILTRNKHTARNPSRIYLLARRAIGNIVISRLEIAHISRMMRHILEHDATRHEPFRIQVHPLEIAGKQWGFGLGGTTPYPH